MSKETSERGERKREAIRVIIYKIMCECVDQKKTPEESVIIVNKHIGVIRGKTPPQENHLLQSVLNEIKSDNLAFCNRMMIREKERHASILHKGPEGSSA